LLFEGLAIDCGSGLSYEVLRDSIVAALALVLALAFAVVVATAT